MQAETDIQRQEQAHRGETLGPDGERGEEEMWSGRWGAREADGWSEEERNPSRETFDPSTAANGTRLFRGKLVRYTDFAEDERDFYRTNNALPHLPDRHAEP